MSDLKPCPLCGDLLEIVRKNGSKYVRCISGICIFETARHGYHISDDELIKRCNRRPAEDALTAEVERLKAELADRDIEGYAGFVLGVDQMKKKLAEKDKEIERLKAIIDELTKPRVGNIKAAVQTARKEVFFGTDTNVPTNADKGSMEEN
jgi:uncharacterized small protein (DUF1192 family)